jgi:hypothetical protein
MVPEPMLRANFDGIGGTAVNGDMSDISYHRLSKEALDLLERDRKERRLFLDFLGVLEDVLASKSAGPEPPLFTSEEREEKALKLTKSLTAKAGLRAVALANREAVFAVSGKRAAKFLSALLEEYNQVRIISQGTERFAVH